MRGGAWRWEPAAPDATNKAKSVVTSVENSLFFLFSLVPPRPRPPFFLQSARDTPPLPVDTPNVGARAGGGRAAAA